MIGKQSDTTRHANEGRHAGQNKSTLNH